MFRITLNYLEKHFLMKEQAYYIPDKEIHTHTHTQTHTHTHTHTQSYMPMHKVKGFWWL